MPTTCSSCHQPFDGLACPRCHGETVLPDTPARADGWVEGAVVCGRYRIVRRVGGGAAGDVYRAEHLGTGGAVALKRLRADRADSENVRARFAFEARATHSLRHPNTVRIIDTGLDEAGRPWLAMEWLEGRTLADVVATDGPLDPARALAYARQLLGSLAEAHAARLVHRDIKPQNLMVLTVPGVAGEAHLKVLDFGVARDLNRDEVQTLHPIGTPRWMAPEMWLGAPAVPSIDVFAAGCVLFHMLTGASVYDGGDEALALDGHDARAWLRRVRQRLDARAVPEVLADVIAAMVSPRRAERPEDAAEALRRLDAAIAGPARRPSWRAWMLGGVVVAALAGGGGLWAHDADAEAPMANGAARTFDADADVAAPVVVVETVERMVDAGGTDAVAGQADMAEVDVAAASELLDAAVTDQAQGEVALKVVPVHAVMAIDGGAFGPPPRVMAVPAPGRSVQVVVQAAGYDTLRARLDAETASGLEGREWQLQLKRKTGGRENKPRLDLDGIDIVPRRAP